jgi:hypothetical protein
MGAQENQGFLVIAAGHQKALDHFDVAGVGLLAGRRGLALHHDQAGQKQNQGGGPAKRHGYLPIADCDLRLQIADCRFNLQS